MMCELPVTKHGPSWIQLIGACYHWATLCFILILVCSQFMSIVWDTTTTPATHLYYGHEPLDGPMQIVGINDVPFDDRVIACVRSEDVFEAWQVSALVEANRTSFVDSTANVKSGYRLVRRPDASPLELDTVAAGVYSNSCNLIAATINNILNACIARDSLRFVPDTDSTDVRNIPESLPILIMPFWDNAAAARHAVPTWDGDACIFRLDEGYIDSEVPRARFRGVNQTVRQSRTKQFLRVEDGGEWRNGWYEDPGGTRWFTDVVSSWDDPRYHMKYRQFDMHTGFEEDCTHTGACDSSTHFVETWGPEYLQWDVSTSVNSVYAANATQYGVFVYESAFMRTVQCLYGWETLLSNTSVCFLLVRWIFSMLALHRGFFLRNSKWHGGGIGCIGSSRSFRLLPLAVLPRLKSSLEAFWTVGCQFEGQQAALSESWFAIYPAIVEIMLVYYSILNTLGIVLRRRLSDALFAPSIMLFCLMHYYRYDLAGSGILDGIDGRIPTVVFSDEVYGLKLVDFFSSDLPLRLNGNIHELFYAKLALLGMNLLPLIFARTLPVTRDHLNGIEKALSFRVQQAGGLANTTNCSASVAFRHLSVVPFLNGIQSDDTRFLNGYQLLRIGYVVFGGTILISFEDWNVLTLLAPLRNMHNLWNYRVTVWMLRDSSSFHGKQVESEFPELWRVDDPRLQQVPFWHLAACDINR